MVTVAFKTCESKLIEEIVHSREWIDVGGWREWRAKETWLIYKA